MKYILEHWVNGDFVLNSLRPVTRENGKYLISDVQRTARSWKEDPVQYVHIYKWATKFVKDKSELGFRRSISHLSNTNGIMTYTVTEDPGTLKCKHTYEEVFGNDLRNIQHPDDHPLWEMNRQKERLLERNMAVSDLNFIIEAKEYDFNCINPIEVWDKPLVSYLKDLFKVSKVWIFILDKVNEHKKQTILSKTATLFQVTHFNYDKKAIIRKDNYHNRAISYWLFDDLLVFQYEEGKDTW